MRLSRIKLAGFKSFVDPTTLQLPSNLLGIVGPNGCGKSNVIDAVRWVLGETSAKHLRGDSMADVIFNGSSARKPVGTAAIELVFDNSDGAIGGQYAGYSEIAIRRSVSRDGTSTYFLNNTRCRRKDITHIFLGTGLGPRSYAIIEQGMISRLIEARPEEMRVYIEEAAGISKFKDRRRETENRMRHTRDNLARLNDLREEVEKHLKHLNRQAATARRYKKLKGRERRTAAELLALKLQELEDKSKAEERLVRERETALEAAIAEQRAVEAAVEKARERHTEKGEIFNGVQARYYQAGAEIARLEQAIQHARELRQRQERDRDEAREGLADIAGHIERDEDELAALDVSLQALLPRLQAAREREQTSGSQLAQAEDAMQGWRERWERFNRRTGDARQVRQVEDARIEHLEDQLRRQTARQQRLREESGHLDIAALEGEIVPLQEQLATLATGLESQQGQLGRTQEQIASAREEERRVAETLDRHKLGLQENAGRLASLEALQRAAERQGGEAADAWLRERGLTERPRLAQALDVSAEWRLAVEMVLGASLDAICVENTGDYADALEHIGEGTLTLVDARRAGRREAAATLDAFADGPAAALSRLASVRAADSLEDALRVRAALAPGESVITRDGTWMGTDWVSVFRPGRSDIGALEREQEIRKLEARGRGLKETIVDAEGRLETVREQLAALEAARESGQGEFNAMHQQKADLTAALDARRSRLQQQRSRRDDLEEELAELSDSSGDLRHKLDAARTRRDEAQTLLESLAAEREELERQRGSLGAALDEVRDRAIADRSSAQELALQAESGRSRQASMQSGLERLRGQLGALETRIADLEEQIRDGESPLAEMQSDLAGMLETSVEVRSELETARRAVESVENELRELDASRLERESVVQSVRESLDQVRLTAREVQVRRETLMEQFQATGFDLAEINAAMPEEAGIERWNEELEAISARISRLGPINLAAIDEFREESQRKEYLDAQHADLTEALTTLENAIRKIDRETRSRFKETFERVDLGFKELFPQLFGGGHAYLELTGDDLLSAGVTVMARPPGKRNSTIHLLSGGEKALTAVALVFSIFRLNPSPFCMLDEVDAPLDDANVVRFCDIVRKMSDAVQFIMITHNKITMEMANQLVGVTMGEPGVSRLVAVDVDEAVQMAAV